MRVSVREWGVGSELANATLTGKCCRRSLRLRVWLCLRQLLASNGEGTSRFSAF